tara:strand:+ start:520 stop:1245 length:726 start_codon:yes stop_codon:yes gene_type:complete
MKSKIQKFIPIFIGYDFRERAATNVLIDSLYQHSTYPLSITPLVTSQLVKQGYHNREREEKQSTDFSFTRFLVPFLMNFEGWAIFMDCDMLCFSDIGELWEQRNEKYSLLCVKHNHKPIEAKKFQGEIQSSYPKKNWSSLMLFNCKKCKSLTIDYVNKSSGLDLHRFNWLESNNQIGSIKGDGWNKLLLEDSITKDFHKNGKSKLVHWTLGGPWFKDQRNKGGNFSTAWFCARDEAMRLWE